MSAANLKTSVALLLLNGSAARRRPAARALLACGVAALLGIAGCAHGELLDDASAPDVAAGDAVERDSAHPDVRADTAVAAACDPGSMVDLDRAGTREGNVLRYRGQTGSARAPSDRCDALAPGEVPGARLRFTVHQQAHLRVSLRNAGTDPGQSYVALLYACGADLAAPVALACGSSAHCDLSVEPAEFYSPQALPPGAGYVLTVGRLEGVRSEAEGFEVTVEELPPIAARSPCETDRVLVPVDLCEPGTECVAPQGGLPGRCAWPGEHGAACRTPNSATEPRCDEGLACMTSPAAPAGRCVPPLALGDACARYATVTGCPADTVCHGYLGVGRCTAPGTAPGVACRADGSCDAGLVPATVALACACEAPGMYAGACEPGATLCPAGSACVSSEASGAHGRCLASGTQGARCDGVACRPGLTCALPRAVCIAELVQGQACDPTGWATECEAGTSCAPYAGRFVCAFDGVIPGTRCAPEAPRCTWPSECTAASLRDAGWCVSPARDACDPRYHTDRCLAPDDCVATGPAGGVCVAPTLEPAVDNDSPASAPVLGVTPALVRGVASAADPRDCYGVRVSPGASLYARLQPLASGSPTAALGGVLQPAELHVTDALGRLIERGSSVAPGAPTVIDGTAREATTHGLPGGTYFVCVHSGAPVLVPLRYALALNVVR